MNYDDIKQPKLRISFDNELIIDNFAGGGGASIGIEQALGRSVDVAVNHDPEAIAMHQANHPKTKHYCEDVFKIDPVEVCGGRVVGLAWFSPDCKHHSKAKGGKPRDKKIRGLAWVAVRWAKKVRPKIIVLENVEEFQDWGPLLENGQPCPVRKGLIFRQFVNELKKIGYKVEYKELRACDYGAPTIRKRLFMIARCDGQPIVWPKPTHGKGLKPYLTAADCIDWHHDCPSIFLTKDQAKKIGVRRPLAEATLRRIAKGVWRYVINNNEPFIVKCGQEVSPFLTEHANGTQQRNFNILEPLRTQCAEVKGGHFALVSAFLAKHYGGVTGHSLKQSIGTVTTVDHHSLVTSNLAILRNNMNGADLKKPFNTVCTSQGHFAEVRSFLIKYYKSDQNPQLEQPMHTVTTKHRMGLVIVAGIEYQIIDVGMRMLQPRELYRAQGFPDEYIIDLKVEGKKLSKAAQVRMCGNSVCPPLARAIVEENYLAKYKNREREALP